MENRVVLGCSSLEAYIAGAQAAAGTDWPVVLIDRSYHSEPPKMREQLLSALEDLPADAVALVAMGFCGGSWDNVVCPRTVVLPHVDDCISLLMHTADTRGVDLKEPGHFYLVNDTQRELAPETIYEHLKEKYGPENGRYIFEDWFRNYTSVDVVDTGINACHTPEYMDMAARNARLIGAEWRAVFFSIIRPRGSEGPPIGAARHCPPCDHRLLGALAANIPACLLNASRHPGGHRWRNGLPHQ